MKRSSMSSKPGCKGDPRMNRAVQARLENPDMPLYHALRVGGFDFPANEDASTLDNDRVTLGQRKNQLLRRLRQLARKQEKEGNELQQAQQQQQPLASSEQVQQPALPPNVDATAGTSVGAGGLYHQVLNQQNQMQLHQFQQQPVPSALNPLQISLVNPTGPPQDQQPQQPPQQQPQQQDGVQLSGTKRKPAPSILDMLFGSDNQIQQTHHLQPPPQGQLAAPSLANLTVGNPIMLPTQVTTLYQGISAPSRPTQIQQDALSDEQKLHAHPLNLLTENQGLLGISAEGGLFTTSTPSSAAQAPAPPETPQEPPGVGQPQSQPAAVAAVANRPAQQQATAPYSAEVLQAKETTALRFFQQELQGLYCRSMLSAGYTPEDTTQRSPYFRRFAFNAWKQECERLQGILGDEPFLPDPEDEDDASNNTNSGQQQQQQATIDPSNTAGV